MEADLVFRILLPLMLISFVLHRGYYTRRLGGRRAQTGQELERSFATSVAEGMSVLAILSSVAYVIRPEALGWASLAFPGWLRWAGTLLFLIGFGLLQWSQAALGANWSDAPTLLDDQQLITNGPYRYIRHPIYTAVILILGALLLVSSNGVVGLAWLSMAIIGVRERILFEESLMLRHFGDQYREYMARTGRWFPRLAKKGLQ